MVTAERTRLNMTEADFIHYCIDVAMGNGPGPLPKSCPLPPDPADREAFRAELKAAALEVKTAVRILREYQRSDRDATPGDRAAIRDAIDRGAMAFDALIGAL